MHQKLILGIIIGISTVVIASWIFLITPILKNDFAAFEDIREYLGKDAYVEHIGDNLPTPIISKDFVKYEIINVDRGIMEIKSHYHTTGIISGETIYENTNTYFVDSATRKHVDNEEWYFIFPTDVQKQDYLLLDPNMEVPATFVFEDTKYIDDLEVYVFSCENIGADFSDAWLEFAPTVVYGDQTCRTSIEPITGKTVEFLITWDMYVIQDGRHVSIERGEAETTDYTELILFESAKNTKQLFYIYDFAVPIFLTLIFVAISFASLYNNKSRERGKIIIKQYEELHQANEIKMDLLKKQAQQEKISTLGELTANLAHDIKNPLAVIKNSSTLISRSNDEITKRESHRIDRSVDRIDHQVNQVLTFVKIPNISLSKLPLFKILRDMIDNVKIPEKIEIILPKVDFDVVCDSEKMIIVFSNILLNAIQAIGDKQGTVTINATYDEDSCKIDFENTGPSIPDEIIPKIMEPLFTTKMEGTGLGLTSCQNILKLHNGKITISNNPTTFSVIFPNNQEDQF